MIEFQHYGLYFGRNQIKEAQKHAKRAPFKVAWELLQTKTPLDLLTSTHWHGLRYRFEGDRDAGEQAALNLPQLLVDEGSPSLFDALRYTLIVAQCVELIRDHPSLQMDALRWFEWRANQIAALENASYVERLWIALAQVVIGVVLEREASIQAGAAVYRGVLEQDIRPAGFIPAVVDGKDGGSLHRFLLTAQALTLIAEAAGQVGLNLWGYQHRGMTIITAGLYPLYYRYYPEQWPWDEGITLEDSERLFRDYGSYLEPLNRQIGRYTKAIDLILSEIRPVYTLWGGGLLTLSHGVRTGWF
ncbi:MAG: alginate lyase family protein [Anaerolineae bacterium]|jgi:hypothetical protein|nr:alginate lyase family protein [Anaerolineae bacterium]